MNTNELDIESNDHIDKGKRRALADPTEQTPLLSGAAQSYHLTESAAPQAHARQNIWKKLMSVFLISLLLCIVTIALFAILAWSYAARASGLTPDDILNKDLTFRGPDSIDVLNITSEGGVWLNVNGRIGMDAGAAIGVDEEQDDGFFRHIWKTIGGWSIRTLDTVSVNLSTITIMPEDDIKTILVTISLPPIEVPLTVNPPPQDLSWLTKVSTPVYLKPTSNSTVLLHFLRNSWRQGSFAVRADVGQAIVRGGYLDRYTWRNRFHGKLSNIRTSLRMKFPLIPGLPPPGRSVPLPSLSSLITLQSFNISTDSKNLTLHAQATAIDPAPESFNMTSPSLPFIVSLPCPSNHSCTPSLPVASVYTDPFTLTHPNITLFITGTVLPLSKSSFPLLSQFVSKYLSGESNPILITSPLLSGLTLATKFPAPTSPPQLLRYITIHNMKIRPSAGAFLASGTVVARVVLPRGMKVDVDVYRVYPDVLVFDGEVLQSTKPLGDPPTTPLPDPLPERAFGHLRPSDWLPSVSVPVAAEDGDGSTYVVKAKVVDVPLEVLPGRQKEFTDFIGKVIFGSGGAVAGILGSAAVTANVHGVPVIGPGNSTGDIELYGLPFQGSVVVGKKSLFASDLGPFKKLFDYLVNLGS